MNTPRLAKASRFVCALAAGAALSGCATYGPAYPAYPAYAAPVAAYPAAPYYGYAYGDPYYDYYGYGPGYFGPALALDFRFHDRGYRGGPGYYHGYLNRGHAWTGPRTGGGHWGGGHWAGGPRGGGGRAFGGGGGGFGGGHGHR
jgi:hypothetical protein